MIGSFRLAAELIQDRPLPARILNGHNAMAIVGCEFATAFSADNAGVWDVQNGTSVCSGRFGIVISPVSCS